MNQTLSYDKARTFPGLEWVWLSLAILLVLASYVWSVNAVVPRWTAREPAGYYGLLTDALLAGQLHLKIEPDPRLAALANPYAGAQDVPRIHDASYFNGHYYLYFGVTPVIILLGPWRFLTGTYLTEVAATAIFASIGFLLSVVLCLRIKNSLFPALTSGWTALGILVLGWGNYAFFLLQNSVVYNVPILAAFACLMAAFCAAEAAFTTSQAERKGLYLGFASLAWGLAVGARPNYAVGLPLLGIVAVIIWWRCGRQHGFRVWLTWRILFWAIVPAALVGAALAWYNYMRFGNIFELGVKYQFAAQDMRFLKLFDPANIRVMLKSYLFAGSYYSPYFPFVSPRADVLGVLAWAPFSALCVLFPLTLLGRPDDRASRWAVLGTVFLCTVVLHLFSLCILPFANDRYDLDFLPTATLVALAVSGAAIVRAKCWPKVVRYTLNLCVAGLAIVTVSQSLLLGLQRHPNKQAQHAIAALFDYPARWWEPALGIKHGAVELKVLFPELIAGRSEPLVISGSSRDIIYLKCLDPVHAQFGYFHEGTGGPLSEPVEVEPGRIYTLSIDMGGLYPPPEHPVFRGWDPSYIDALRRRVDVRLDGRLLLHWISSFYPSDPSKILIGKNPRGDATTRFLQASIISATRAGVPSPDNVSSLPGDGPIHLALKFPPFKNFGSQPLISTGRPGAGDLVYVTYLDRGRLRFGHDSWGAGNVETLDVEYDPSRDHTVDVDMGSLHLSAAGLSESKTRFQLCFDDKLLISTFRPFHPSSPVDLSIGFNQTGSSASATIFMGPVLRAARLPSFPKAPVVYPGFGAFRIRAKLPAHSQGLREPIMVTGRRNAGDLIYIIYEDDHHVRLAHDHWGGSSTTGGSIEVNYGKPVEFLVRMASLFPDEISRDWGEIDMEKRRALRLRTSVEVNGTPVLETSVVAYDVQPDEIYVGQNPIGGSSCSNAFTGAILAVEREGFPH